MKLASDVLTGFSSLLGGENENVLVEAGSKTLDTTEEDVTAALKVLTAGTDDACDGVVKSNLNPPIFGGVVVTGFTGATTVVETEASVEIGVDSTLEIGVGSTLKTGADVMVVSSAVVAGEVVTSVLSKTEVDDVGATEYAGMDLLCGKVMTDGRDTTAAVLDPLVMNTEDDDWVFVIVSTGAI